MSGRHPIPASFFGIILGLVGLGSDWRVAAKIWNLPRSVGEVIMLLAILCWIVIAALFAVKWMKDPEEARTEFGHPVACCFVGLAPVSTALIGLALIPYSRGVAQVFFWVGAVGQLSFSVYRTGQLWMGGRDPATTTPVLYLPSVAGSFVTSIVASALGYADIAPLFFGAGLFSWLAIESVILQRLYVLEAMPKPLRPTLGIQLAPPVVGCVAYLGITAGRPDLFAQMLLGYGLMQVLILIRLVGWLREQPFGAGYWAFTFGVTALALSSLRFVERGLTGVFIPLAIAAFLLANLVVVAVAIQSIRLLLRGTFVPPALRPATPAA